jgi:hypothetical protein
MDLSKISTKDLEYINAGQLDKVSTAGLEEYARQETLASQPRSLGQEFTRGAGLAGRGATPVAAGAGLGFMFGGAPGALAGTIALPLAEVGTQGLNLVLPEKYQIPSPVAGVESLLTRLGFPVAETTGERVIQAAGGVLPSTAFQTATAQALSKTAQSQLGRNIAGEMAKAPERQLMAAVPATAAAQYTTEATGSPIAGMVAGMATGVPFAAGTRPTGPSREVLAAQSTAAFEAAKNSGIAFNPSRFSTSMGRIAADLRQEGYTPTAYPKVEAVVRELTDVNMPKDFTELQALRKMIQNAQASTDPAERRLATILKDRFDDYVVNADKSDIIGAGNKTGVAAWNQARNTYSRMMKADVFEDMLANAQLDQSKFTQSGAENSMAQQLRSLAKNQNKMRLFTPAEQKEIIAAAKGSTTQNLLKFFGRFAPTGPVSSILPGGAIVANPYVGVPLALGATGARMGATSLRRQSVENLADIMRTGGLQPRQTSATRALAARGLISPQQPVTEEEINLLMGR